MLAAAGVIWTIVIGVAIYAVRANPKPDEGQRGSRLVIYLGVIFPVVALGALLTYGLTLMPDLRSPGDGLTVAVTGEQWWWRVEYRSPELDAPVVSANEIRMPVGQRTEFILESADVIHSFWIPPLGGKMDMTPGHVTRLVLEPTETGTYRGVCAEFCGTSHALMAFSVIVMEEEAFARWLAEEAAPADPPATPVAERGATLFAQVGCGACHTVRGTAADGVVGPDLTHLASRATLGGGILPNDPETLAEWISDTEALKPGVLMPSFGMLPEDDLDAIVAYLEGLE